MQQHKQHGPPLTVSAAHAAATLVACAPAGVAAARLSSGWLVGSHHNIHAASCMHARAAALVVVARTGLRAGMVVGAGPELAAPALLAHTGEVAA